MRVLRSGPLPTSAIFRYCSPQFPLSLFTHYSCIRSRQLPNEIRVYASRVVEIAAAKLVIELTRQNRRRTLDDSIKASFFFEFLILFCRLLSVNYCVIKLAVPSHCETFKVYMYYLAHTNQIQTRNR